jgi:SAM-dependent methyltransferase
MIERRELATTAEIAEWYDRKFTEMGGAWKTPDSEWAEHLARMCVVNGNLIDLGCGDGSFIRYATGKYPGLMGYGIDISFVGIMMAYVTLSHTPDNERQHFLIRDMADTQMLPASFDYAVSLGSMEHCLDIPRVLREARRILKPGGTLYIYAPNETWTATDQPNETLMNFDEWEERLHHAGLRVDGYWPLGNNNAYLARRIP